MACSPPQDFITAAKGQGGLGFPAGSTGQYFFTNQFDATGKPLPFDTPNGLVASPGEWHIEKPISAVQDQLSLRRTFGRHPLSIGAYFANYTQDQSLVLHRHPDRRARQSHASSTWW